jgi:membrane protease YdiL (CAAX protease family)
MGHVRSNETIELPLVRGQTTYVVTSLLLAAAWHARFGYGLWIVNAVAAVVGILLAGITLGRSWRQALGWSRGNALLGVGLGLALVLATQLGARLLLPLMPPVLTETHKLYGILQGSLEPAHYSPIVALVAIAEELVYRGVVTSLCERKQTPGWTVIIATALYALPLVGSGSWLLVAIGVTLGACLTVAKLRSGSLLVPIVAHVIWSEVTFVLVTVG